MRTYLKKILKGVALKTAIFGKQVHNLGTRLIYCSSALRCFVAAHLVMLHRICWTDVCIHIAEGYSATASKWRTCYHLLVHEKKVLSC